MAIEWEEFKYGSNVDHCCWLGETEVRITQVKSLYYAKLLGIDVLLDSNNLEDAKPEAIEELRERLKKSLAAIDAEDQ